MGGMRAWLSWRFAAEMPIEQRQAAAVDDEVDFRPFLPRSVGFGPVSSPL